LAKQGAHIILLDKNIAKLETVYDAIVGQKLQRPLCIHSIWPVLTKTTIRN